MDIEHALKKDSQTMAELIYSSGPKAFDYVFSKEGKRQLTRSYLRHAFERGIGQYSYKNHCVVRQGGEVVGSMFNYDVRSLSRMHLSTVMSVCGFFRWGIFGVAKRSGVIDEVIKRPAHDVLVVAHLAVAPQAQGLGVGSQMIEFARKQAEENGYSGLALDVSVENPNAQRLYERLGFVVIAENPSPVTDVPDHRHMELRFL